MQPVCEALRECLVWGPLAVASVAALRGIPGGPVKGKSEASLDRAAGYATFAAKDR